MHEHSLLDVYHHIVSTVVIGLPPGAELLIVYAAVMHIQGYFLFKISSFFSRSLIY